MHHKQTLKQTVNFGLGSVAILALGFLLFSYTNCGGFAGDLGGDKKNLLSSTSLLNQNNAVNDDHDCVDYGDGAPQIECPSPTPSMSPTPNPSPTPEPTPTPTPPPPSVDIGAPTMCSHMAMQIAGTGLKYQEKVKFMLQDRNNVSVTKCEMKIEGLRSEIINTRKIVIQSLKQQCPTLTPGNYKMMIVPWDAQPPFKSLSFTVGNIWTADGFTVAAGVTNGFEVKVEATSYGDLKLTSAQLMPGINGPVMAPHVLYDFNQTAGGVGQTAECSLSASPLLVQISRAPRPIELTAPTEGIDFDIFGERNQHKKSRISWLTPASAKVNFFVVLPNKDGDVKGINELFGDNTKGPDGKFSANGYEALAKHDGLKDDGSIDYDLRDGFITEKDPVYQKLRLWSDLNADGVAQPAELFKLGEKKVELIDLSFDPTYAEADQYGNEIKMKSVMKTHDGRLHLMYDIWFRAL